MQLKAVLIPVAAALCAILPWVLFLPFASWGGTLAVLAALLVSVAVVSVAFTTVKETRRREALRRSAPDLGCTFDPEGRDVPAGLAALPLFEQHAGSQFQNVLRQHLQETEIILGEHTFPVGGGTHRYLYRHTLVAFQVPSYGVLPDFILGPRRFGRCLTVARGSHGVVAFDAHPRFAHRYQVAGPDASAVRQLFRPDVLAFFEGSHLWCVEARGRWLLVYRPLHGRFRRADWRLKPSQLAGLLDETKRMLALVVATMGTSSGH